MIEIDHKKEKRFKFKINIDWDENFGYVAVVWIIALILSIILPYNTPYKYYEPEFNGLIYGSLWTLGVWFLGMAFIGVMMSKGYWNNKDIVPGTLFAVSMILILVLLLNFIISPHIMNPTRNMPKTYIKQCHKENLTSKECMLDYIKHKDYQY